MKSSISYKIQVQVFVIVVSIYSLNGSSYITVIINYHSPFLVLGIKVRYHTQSKAFSTEVKTQPNDNLWK